MIILRPVITEKSIRAAEKRQYSFEVVKSATKKQIAQAVADKFNVRVLKVMTMNVKPTVKMQRTRRKFFTVGGMKKTMVEIDKKQSIPLFENIKADGPTGSTGSPQASSAQGGVVVTTAEAEPQIIKEKRDFLRRTKIRVEKGAVGATPTTQRKVITGK